MTTQQNTDALIAELEETHFGEPGADSYIERATEALKASEAARVAAEAKLAAMMNLADEYNNQFPDTDFVAGQVWASKAILEAAPAAPAPTDEHGTLAHRLRLFAEFMETGQKIPTWAPDTFRSAADALAVPSEATTDETANAWDEGVDAAFRGAIMRQNASDVKRTNPYRLPVAVEGITDETHTVRQVPPFPPYPNADYGLTRWECSCGWRTGDVRAARSNNAELDAMEAEATAHREGITPTETGTEASE